MREEFLYYLWENRLLNLDLKTTEGEDVTILSVGSRNFDSGADFVNARVRINGTLWAGQVEIHVRASDWFTFILSSYLYIASFFVHNSVASSKPLTFSSSHNSFF